MTGVVHDLVTHWYIDLSIPVVAAIIGYVTKLVAIRMMFEPLEFMGIRPYLGWQGIVPRRAARMASIAVDTMTRVGPPAGVEPIHCRVCAAVDTYVGPAGQISSGPNSPATYGRVPGS